MLFRSTLCLGILVNRLEFSPNVLELTPCPPCPPYPPYCSRLARHHRGDPQQRHGEEKREEKGEEFQREEEGVLPVRSA